MPSHKRTSALEKALAVLEAVSDQPQPIGLPDLAARLNLPRQTVHRVLSQLEKLKLVIRDPSRERYSVGPKLSRLAFGTLRSLNQSAPIRVILQDLVDEIGETCNIGVLDDLDYIYLQRIECHWPLRLHQDAGARVPAHTVSGGKVLLANLDPDLTRRLLKARKLKASTPHTITRIADLEAEFVKVRADGFALNNQERLDGLVGVAVPVLDPDGNVLAAIGMHGPLPRLTVKVCERHIPRLRHAAERMARVWLA
jgi:IclR family transcriptional regulator, acetate operon repressor